jgi:diguanylate cyclase (GGDEF)-like protein
MGEAAHSDNLGEDAREALRRLADENALLRASIAELRQRLAELEASADTDPLTGLPNERVLAEQLERVASRCARHGTSAALLAIDIRALREINAKHGRVAGDAALRHLARLLQGLIRASDLAARLNGGFGLLLDHLDSDSAIETGERIARFVASQPLDIGGTELALDLTIGVAAILPGDTPDDVLHRAHRNLARVKEF